jgi:hypothetical protein
MTKTAAEEAQDVVLRAEMLAGPRFLRIKERYGRRDAGCRKKLLN